MIQAATLPVLLKQLRLSTMAQLWEPMLLKAQNEQWDASQYLTALCEQELLDRYSRRIERFTKESRLPVGKTLPSFDFDLTPDLDPNKINALAGNRDWVSNTVNLLFFGPSGVGKTHLAVAIAHALIEKSIRVKYYPATALVQQMQKARQELKLESFLTKLDKYAVLVLDDLGYVKKSDLESHVLFELIAHRYETGSLIITSNQPFSQWDSIFTDSSMTVAAIDRVVHHSIIIEVKAESYRKRQAIAQNRMDVHFTRSENSSQVELKTPSG